MASVRDDDPEDYQRLDYSLLQNGAVTLYWRPAYLDADVEWLTTHGYRVHRWDASAWSSVEQMHDDLARELAFPDYYGRNLDALNDCLRDLKMPREGGVALVLRRFDAFALREPRVAEAILDIAEHASRGYLVFGHRFVVLVQSDDPQITFGPLGAVSASWNRREWLTASRNPGEPT